MFSKFQYPVKKEEEDLYECESLDVESSDDEAFELPKSTLSSNHNRFESRSRLSAVKPGKQSSRAICDYCKKQTTLKIGGKRYLCSSSSRPDLRICNACKSYEYRHGYLIDRSQRKNKSRKRCRNEKKADSRKRQLYNHVKIENQQIESEPLWLWETRKKTKASAPAHGLPSFCKKQTHSVTMSRQPNVEDIYPMESEDLHCNQCRKQVKEVSQLIMCAGCEKIYHADCYVLAGGANSFKRGPKTILCRDHAFKKCNDDKGLRLSISRSPSLNKEVADEMLTTLPPLQSFEKENRASLSRACFDSMDNVVSNADTVITPDYANQNLLLNLEDFNEEDMHKLEQAKLETIGSKFLLSCGI